MFTSIQYVDKRLRLLDQRQLPAKEDWLSCDTVESVATAIETMVVRGAPAIADAAALALAQAAATRAQRTGCWKDDQAQFERELARLASTRPTAVNLFQVLQRMKAVAEKMQPELSRREAARLLEAEAIQILADDLATCRAIGTFGLEWGRALGKHQLRVLTHCNTGSLATAGYGTALGIIRSLAAADMLSMVYVDETRPYLQGSRLTAYELGVEDIPYKLICDSAAACLMRRGEVDVVLVGADRIAANGDTVNKIGTYGLAVLAQHHKVPFVVAAPLTTFDLELTSGDLITIEERDPDEVRSISGQPIAPSGAPVFNPAFDLTPGGLVTAIITDRGVVQPVSAQEIARIAT